MRHPVPHQAGQAVHQGRAPHDAAAQYDRHPALGRGQVHGVPGEYNNDDDNDDDDDDNDDDNDNEIR